MNELRNISVLETKYRKIDYYNHNYDNNQYY